MTTIHIGPAPADPRSAITGAVLLAAKRGDVDQVNAAELYYIRNADARPVPPAEVPTAKIKQYQYRLEALDLVRGGDRLEILWGYATPHNPDADAIWTFRTDMDLNVIPGSIGEDHCPWCQWESLKA